MSHSPLSLLLPLFAATIAISPLALDMYLPAMAQMAADFNTDIAHVQQSMSIYLIGYALGMLVFGPLTVKYGRPNLMRLGLIGFAFTSLLLVTAPSIELFCLIRFFQAFVGAAATVVIPGYIRQLYGAQTAKGMSYVSIIMMLAPLIAPSIGTALMIFFGWQSIFLLLTCYACFIVTLSFMLRLPVDDTVDPTQKVSFFNSYKTVLTYPDIKPALIASVCASFAFFCYLTASPMLYLSVFALDSHTFTMVFALNVLGLIVANLINARLVGRLGSKRLLKIASTFALFCAGALICASMFQAPAMVQMVLIPLIVTGGAIAGVNADALVLMQFKQEAGTATAVIGTLRFGCGAMAGPLIALGNTSNATLFAMIVTSALFIVMCCGWLTKSQLATVDH